ncbi:MAG: hypothetical protein HYX29_11810 [Solirubrobacterales bacterium]|nr:hypothetical protein [Solirubrobacterales bacterium]
MDLQIALGEQLKLSETRSITWVDVAGYLHEPLHTRMLNALLEAASPSVRGEMLARLTDDPKFKRELQITPDLEHSYVPRRRVDLALEVRSESGPLARVAVETKVDSKWSEDQLFSSLDESVEIGILFLVGMTSLSVTQHQLAELKSPAGERNPWHVVQVKDWLDTLTAARSDLILAPEILDPYIAAVQRECDAHALAVERVRAGSSATAINAEFAGDSRHRGKLSHHAYFNVLFDDPKVWEKWRPGGKTNGQICRTRFTFRQLDPGESAGALIEIWGIGESRQLDVKVWDTRSDSNLDEVRSQMISKFHGPRDDGFKTTNRKSASTIGSRSLPLDLSARVFSNELSNFCDEVDDAVADCFDSR